MQTKGKENSECLYSRLMRSKFSVMSGWIGRKKAIEKFIKGAVKFKITKNRREKRKEFEEAIAYRWYLDDTRVVYY